MEGQDDFFTGGPSGGSGEGEPIAQEMSTVDGSLEGGYTDLGGEYGGGFDQQGGVGQQGLGFQQQQYTSLGEPQDMGMPAPEDVAPNALDEFIGRWEVTLREKAALEEAAKDAALEAAKVDLETHAIDRNATKEAKMSKNREQEQVFLEQLEGELESENPWERVVSLVDTQAEITGDFQDTSRMTSLFIQLKNDLPHKVGRQ
ncbi:unnamed protein product [Discosporangium mesarthrocarpum]